MKHKQSIRKFGRVKKQREALLRSLALSLINKGKIKTTKAKAKELRPYVEKVVTRAKKDTIASRRLIRSKLGADNKKLFNEIALKYKKRDGGYTRITKLINRESDGAEMAIIEFI